MGTRYWTERRVAGVFLLAGVVFPVIAAIILIASGALAGFQPMISGRLTEVAPYVATFRLLILLFILGWIGQLLGFGLFARLLTRAGQGQVAILTFLLIALTTILAIVNFGFRMSVELWAVEQLAEGGMLPPLYAVLRTWTSNLFRLGYRLHFLAVAGVGWAILRGRLLSPGLGWAAIGWSALWFFGALVGVGAPAVPLLMPAAIGIALLFGRPDGAAREGPPVGRGVTEGESKPSATADS